MKRFFLILAFFFIAAAFTEGRGQTPFYRAGKHKLVKKMTRKQVREIQKGKTFYFHKKGKLKRI